MLDALRRRVQHCDMNTIRMQIFSLGLFILMTAAFSAARADVTNSPPPRLIVELHDGSQLVGNSEDQFIRFHSIPLGDLKLDMKDIRSIECASTNSAKLVITGNDTLTVSFVDTAIMVETKIGKLALPVNSVRKLIVQVMDSSGVLIPEQATAYANDCLNNLRQIDGAANQFALEQGKKTGDPINFPTDLKPYIRLDRNGNIPGCPLGGVYTLKKVGDMPTCSLGDTVKPAHVLP